MSTTDRYHPDNRHPERRVSRRVNEWRVKCEAAKREEEDEPTRKN